MKLEFRQRLLASTLLVGASMVATPAFAQVTAPPPPGEDQAPDTSAVTTIPETTTPPEGQTVVTESAQGEPIETPADIVVTGTRIPQPNLESASPVTVVTAQEVKLQGTTRTEDLINSLPQSFAAQGSNVANGATGTATVNLRGLGTGRTLVLVNGRRLHPGDPRQPVADINFIPAPLIRRVDVLTGGASSVYGADAVAGVVNFIMDTTFRGLRVDAQASAFMHNNDTAEGVLEANAAQGFRPPSGNSINGGTADLAVAFGAGFDDNRGSVLGYATYRKQDAVLQSTRDYSFCATQALPQSGSSTGNDIDTLGRRFNCGGSGTSAEGNFFTNVGVFHVEGDQFVPGSTLFNYAPYNYFQRPNERYTLGAFAEYEISRAATPYLEAMFMDDRSVAQIAPSGNFFTTNTIACDNALLSDQQREAICVEAVYDPADATPEFDEDGDPIFESNFGNLVGQTPIFIEDEEGNVIGLSGFTDPTTFTGPTGEFNQAIAYIARRNVEGGGRQDDLQHTSYRLVGGVRGDLHRGLSYDAYYSFGRTTLMQTYLNDFSITRIGRAIDVVEDPDTGNLVCRSALSGLDTNCVPWNIFTTGGVSQAALSYLQVPGFQRGDVTQEIAQVDFTVLGGEYGLLSPWADRGIGLNVGAAYARHALETKVDQAFQTGDLAGQGGPTLPVSGNYDVRELFGEVEIPIISRSFIEEFTLRGGYRYSDYKVADRTFSTDTYKIEAELAPVRDIRFRGSYNRAVRAPNVVELFTSQQIGLAGTNDPCANQPETGDPLATLAECQRTGVTAAQYGNILANPANQYNALFGGNPDLTPEVADTYTLGVVLQPRFVPGLAVTVDWFDIQLENAISTGVAPFDQVLEQCLSSGNLCELIQRAPNGSLWLPVTNVANGGFVNLANVNIGGLGTRGMDFQASYARGLGTFGNLNLSFVGTWLDELTVNPFGDVEYDCAGFYGATCTNGNLTSPNPEWRHKFRAGVTFPNGIGVSGQWRYFSAVENDALSGDDDLAGTSNPANDRISAVSYFDLALSARMAERYNFRLGMNNVFDRDPPIVGSELAGPPFGNGNTYPQVYDALGRFIFAGVTVDF